MSLVDDIKNQVKKSGTNKGKFLYFKAGTKIRVRFLNDMDDGLKVLFHDSYELGVNLPCQELFDRECSHCENDELRHRDQYIWSVWDYEAKEVKLLMGAVNNASPIPALVGLFDSYGTLVDRDYVITKNGQGTQTTYTVVPMDKAKFRNDKAKPYSESKVLSMLDKAFPDENADDSDVDEEDEKPKKSKKSNKKADNKKSSKRKQDDEDEDDEDDEDEKPSKSKSKSKKKDEDEDEVDYEDMTAKELYKLCKEKDLKVKPKMDEEYYIEKLEAADADDEDEEDEW